MIRFFLRKVEEAPTEEEKKRAADAALRANAERLQFLALQIEVQSRRRDMQNG